MRWLRKRSFATFAKHWEQAGTEAVQYQSAKQDGSNVTLAAPVSETPENRIRASEWMRRLRMPSFATFAKHWEQATDEAVQYQSAKQDGSNVTLAAPALTTTH